MLRGPHRFVSTQVALNRTHNLLGTHNCPPRKVLTGHVVGGAALGGKDGTWSFGLDLYEMLSKNLWA